MKLILMGPPACGKGTIGEMLSNKLGIPSVSVGSLLRAVPESSPFYKDIHEPMLQGKLVPNDKAGLILKEELSKPEYEKGYILDGWFRQETDKDAFDPHPDYIIYIKISDQTSIRRISGRRICQDNGEIYNIYTLPADKLKEMQECKVLIHRDDDKKEVVQTRLESFYKQTLPVVNHYEKLGKVIEIDGEGTPDEVFNLVLDALKISK